jgi:hypothetical protein
MKKGISKFGVAVAAAISLATVEITSAQLNSPQIPPSANGGSGSSIAVQLTNIVISFKNISTGIYSSLFVVALILFFAGIFRFFLSKEKDAHEQGYKFMGFGVVALFVMVGVWGIVAFISQTLNIGVGGDIPTPGVPQSVRTY